MNKFDYLSHIFNVRTYGKKYENYIVNAIYERVRNPELVPVTQQFVHSSKDERKYYLLDLYFPQINYGIEVDERQHLEEENKLKDIIRQDDIKNAISCDEGRIQIFKPNGEPKIPRMLSYEEIDKQIDEQVAIIQKRIKTYGKLIWETNDDVKQHVIENETFNVKDNVEFSSITEIYNMVGHKVKQLGRCYVKLNEKYHLWVPTMAIKLDNGLIKSVNNYENYLTEDWGEIIEIDKTQSRIKTQSGVFNEMTNRVVFMKMRNRFGKSCVKFVGVFKGEKAIIENGKLQRHFKRIETCISFSSMKPKRFEPKS